MGDKPHTCKHCDTVIARGDTLCQPCYEEEWRDDHDEADDDDFVEICHECGGTGEVPDNGTNLGECEECNGTGELDY